jgi:hypothetical protein
MPYRKGRIDRVTERSILWRMLVELSRSYHLTHFPGESFEANVGMLLVWMTVGLGHVEGKPMNATKIAETMNMPRATAIRKLKELVQRGILLRMGQIYILNEDQVGAISGHIPDLVRAVEHAYLELAKVGAVDVSKVSRVSKMTTVSKMSKVSESVT